MADLETFLHFTGHLGPITPIARHRPLNFKSLHKQIELETIVCPVAVSGRWQVSYAKRHKMVIELADTRQIQSMLSEVGRLKAPVINYDLPVLQRWMEHLKKGSSSD